MLQNLCYGSLGWDEKIPENLARELEYWKEKLLLLKNIQIDRCLKPSCGFEDTVEASLNLFSDTSELGYGQCSYIRLVTDTRKYTAVCRLIKPWPHLRSLFPCQEWNSPQLCFL